jgi:hypothetical protein
VSTVPAGLAAGPPAGPAVSSPAGGRGRPAAGDVLVAVRTCYGWLLACAPRRMLRIGGAQPPSRPEVAVTRVLGGRHLAQALLTAAAEAAGLPPAAVFAAGAAVDAVHAASMAGLAVMSRPLRRATLTDAALETGLATAGLLAAWDGREQRADPWAAATSPER